jgi:hypothetical protein
VPLNLIDCDPLVFRCVTIRSSSHRPLAFPSPSPNPSLAILFFQRMAPFSRFTASKYKNQLLEPAKNDQKFTEIPAVTPATAVNGRSIVCNDQVLAISLGIFFSCSQDKATDDVGTAVGLVDWRLTTRKLAGKMEKVAVEGNVQDIQFSGTERKLLGIVTSSGVHPQFQQLIDLGSDPKTRRRRKGGDRESSQIHDDGVSFPCTRNHVHDHR